jgi:hypothetical protein
MQELPTSPPDMPGSIMTFVVQPSSEDNQDVTASTSITNILSVQYLSCSRNGLSNAHFQVP